MNIINSRINGAMSGMAYSDNDNVFEFENEEESDDDNFYDKMGRKKRKKVMMNTALANTSLDIWNNCEFLCMPLFYLDYSLLPTPDLHYSDFPRVFKSTKMQSTEEGGTMQHRCLSWL